MPWWGWVITGFGAFWSLVILFALGLVAVAIGKDEF